MVFNNPLGVTARSQSRDDGKIKLTVSGNRTVKATGAVVDTSTGDNAWSGVIEKSAYGYESDDRRRTAYAGYRDATGALAVDVLLGEDPRDRCTQKKDERGYEEQ